MKKYAMMFMNPMFEPQKSHFNVDGIEHHIVFVRNDEEAITMALKLANNDIKVLEVCGAFGKDLAQKIYDVVDKRLCVGYVTYPDEQVEALERFWKSK